MNKRARMVRVAQLVRERRQLEEESLRLTIELAMIESNLEWNDPFNEWIMAEAFLLQTRIRELDEMVRGISQLIENHLLCLAFA